MSGHGVTVFVIGLVMLIAACLARVAVAQEEKAVETDQCVVCHVENELLPEDYIEDDIHMKMGLTCADCHGGDATSDDDEVAMSAEAGFVGAPAKKDLPRFCGRCHSDTDYMRRYRPRIPTDQVKQYFASLHGIRLKQGDEKVADCASCHTAHGVLAVTDSRSSVYALNVPATCNRCHGDAEYMKGYGIPTNQYNKFAKGVHGKALLEDQDVGAPACNDCHGNHGVMPPGISSVRQVCGNCHVNNMRFFTASKMGAAFEKEELHGCEECHSNHDIEKTSDAMVGTGEDAVCTDCHAAGDKGYEMAGAISALLGELTTAYADAEEKRDEVHRIGMDDVEIGFVLQEARQSLIQARTSVHTFDAELVREKTTEGTAKAREALGLAIAQIEESHVRRRGFGMATVFISLLALALFLKIRQLSDS